MGPLAMLPSMIPLQLSPMSTMPPAMSQSPTSTWSPLLPPLLPHLPSPTPPTLTPTPPTPTPMLDTLDTPTPLLLTTPAVSTTLAALCPAPKRPASKLRPKDRRRTAKDRGRLENENWILEDVV